MDHELDDDCMFWFRISGLGLVAWASNLKASRTVSRQDYLQQGVQGKSNANSYEHVVSSIVSYHLCSISIAIHISTMTTMTP